MKKWICHKDFKDLAPLSLYGKELDKKTPPPAEITNHHSLFRKTFNIEGTIPGTKLDITGDDYYKLYINGVFIGQGPANSYRFAYNFNTYDITEFLREGENVVAVHCYYHGLVNRAYNSADRRQGIWARCFYGERVLFETDGDFKCTRAEWFDENPAVLGYNTQFAENIDGRRFPAGWTDTGFDDSEWGFACIPAADDHILTPQITPPVDTYTLPFSTVRIFGEGHFLLDFGRETVGCARLCTIGKEGSAVRLFFAEELTEDGHARFEMRCNLNYEERWILPHGACTLENFEYKGFRYLEVIADDASVRLEHFSVVCRHYPIEKKAHFTGDDPLLRDIYNVCERAVIISTQEGYLDCPTREKGQYLGDLLVTSLSHYYISGDLRIYKKALDDFANSLFICPGMMAVVPGSFMQEIADYSLIYPLLLENYFRLSGDKAALEKYFPAAKSVTEYFAKYQSGALIESVTDKWNLVDWPQNLRDNYAFELTRPIGKGLHNVINAYYYGACDTVNRLADLLGLAPVYDTESIKKAYRKAFFCEKTGLFTDDKKKTHSSLHSNVLPYFFGMTEPAENARIADFILQKGFSCGVYFAYFVLKSLTNHGEHEKAMTLLKNRSERSWANMLTEGATACFEAWGKDQKRNTSLCHPWASAPIIIFAEDFGLVER